MWRQIWKLAGISLRNVGGWNRVKYGKDKKEKNKLLLLLVVYVFVGAALAGYSALLAYGLGTMGLADVIPAYVAAVLGVIILFFSMFTAGSVIFDIRTYEMLAPLLPMTVATLAGALITGIGSRMKHKNLVVAALTMVLTLGGVSPPLCLRQPPEPISTGICCRIWPRACRFRSTAFILLPACLRRA